MTLRGGRRARPRTYIRKRSPMARTLLDKVWEAHTVRTLPSGQTQLLIGLLLIHEVTTPQAFQMLKELKLKVRMPERTFGTLDHIIPTADQTRPYADPEAEEMAAHMYRNMKDFNLQLFDMSTGKQGIVHVIGPELGLTQPGMTIACGDSHTSTHGAVGAIAFGIGTTQVRDVLATQCLAPGQRALDAHLAQLRLGHGEALRGEHVAHLGRPDAERDGADGAVRRSMAVAARDGHARLREAQLRPDDVDDALLARRHVEELQIEVLHVAVHVRGHLLRLGVGVGTGLVGRRDDVIERAERALRHPDLELQLLEHLEGLRRRHLVDEVQADQ